MGTGDESIPGQTATYEAFRRGLIFNRLPRETVRRSGWLVKTPLNPRLGFAIATPEVADFGDVEELHQAELGETLRHSAVCLVAGLTGCCPERRGCSRLGLNAETCGRGFRWGRRPAPHEAVLNKVAAKGVESDGVVAWSKDDSLPMEAIGKETFGDSRRQIFMVRIGAWGGFFGGGLLPAVASDSSEDAAGYQPAMNVKQSLSRVSHDRRLMQRGLCWRKRLVRHDKKRQIQNSLSSLLFWPVYFSVRFRRSVRPSGSLASEAAGGVAAGKSAGDRSPPPIPRSAKPLVVHHWQSADTV